MDDILSLSARNFRLAQSEAERVFLDEVIESIRDDPTQGTLLPFPSQPGSRQLDRNGYSFFYVYRDEHHYLFIRTVRLFPMYP